MFQKPTWRPIETFAYADAHFTYAGLTRQSQSRVGSSAVYAVDATAQRVCQIVEQRMNSIVCGLPLGTQKNSYCASTSLIVLHNEIERRTSISTEYAANIAQ